MIEKIFINMTQALYGSWGLALTAALGWGMLSVLLSPCHLSSIPLIIGFISGQGRSTTGKAFRMSLVFSLGILVSIAVIGAVTAGLGRMAGDLGKWGNYAVAAVFFVVGLYLLGCLPWLSNISGAAPRALGSGYSGAFLLGLIFGVALGPCTFAYMAPILGLVFQYGSTNPLFAFGLVFAYGLGHCGVIAVAGGSAGLVQKYLDFGEKSRALDLFKKACGLLVIAGGVYLIYTVR
ncbi:MAG: cytochrome c biogenesis protein CcdA [Candidatus Wallbacteria bacterium]|nr:cytochrome c biogenesis protein CcdA [Candidatus Wallbacteria bacterium]